MIERGFHKVLGGTGVCFVGRRLRLLVVSTKEKKGLVINNCRCKG